MTNDQKRAKIAESLGATWRDHFESDYTGFSIKGKVLCFVDFMWSSNDSPAPPLITLEEGKFLHDKVPTYLKSYDAAAQMRAALTQDERYAFTYALEDIMGIDLRETRDANEVFRLINATPAQQCEAYAKVRGLW